MVEIDEELAAAVRARVGLAVCSGRYSIEHVLGIGGMAAVYAGTHRNGRKVALKFLHPEFSRRADIRKRFLREGLAANAVAHPGVVAVIDDDVAEDGSAFLVMERLEGKSLEQLWAELGRRFPARVVLAIGRDLCEVLAVAHRAGIYHRDLKPENLFLTDDGKLKVLDFGLAHLRDAARPKDTHTGMVFGTPAFMPPEQASGETSKIDARTDVWAAGATLFTLLSGELVHRGETAQHFVMLAAMEPARSLAAVLPHAHPVLVEIIDRALARDKDSRWQSAAAMREAILSGMDFVLGDHDLSLPTPTSLTEMVGAQKPRTVPLVPPSAPDEVTTPRKAAVVAVGMPSDLEETFSDRTRVDTRLDVPPESGPDTQPNLVRPIAGGGSDTPTDQTTPDELPTKVRNEAVTAQRTSERTPVDPARRASWSDLRRAIADEPRPKKFDTTAKLVDETQLLPPVPRSDRTKILGRDHPAVATARAAAPSSPAFAIPQDRASYPAPMPLPRTAQRTHPSIKRKPTSPIPYLPVVGAAILLGLSPLAYFIARDCGSSGNDGPTRVIVTPDASTPSIASARVPSPTSGDAPGASGVIPSVSPRDAASSEPAASDAGPAEHSVPSEVRTGAVAPPRPSARAIPPNPYDTPLGHAVGQGPGTCIHPFVTDDAGIRRPRLECF